MLSGIKVRLRVFSFCVCVCFVFLFALLLTLSSSWNRIEDSHFFLLLCSSLKLLITHIKIFNFRKYGVFDPESDCLCFPTLKTCPPKLKLSWWFKEAWAVERVLVTILMITRYKRSPILCWRNFLCVCVCVCVVVLLFLFALLVKELTRHQCACIHPLLSPQPLPTSSWCGVHYGRSIPVEMSFFFPPSVPHV